MWRGPGRPIFVLVFNDAIVVQSEDDDNVVSTQRIVPLGPPIRRCQLAIITGAAVVIKDDLLIKVTQITHVRKISLALSIAAYNESISATVL